jgi:uncharacterized membrane protein YdjX (TVP38/TMEM64 family)
MKRTIVSFLSFLCLGLTISAAYWLGGIDSRQIQDWLQTWGIFAPIVYVLLYCLATILFLPSTPLNLASGAVFGAFWGTIWASIGAVMAAFLCFAFTRTIGREKIAKKLSGKWFDLDREIEKGGILYVFIARLIPLVPYGLLNFGAGLTSVSWRDYTIGTFLGTTLGITPYVMMGAGLTGIRRGDISLLLISIAAIVGTIVIARRWKKRS